VTPVRARPRPIGVVIASTELGKRERNVTADLRERQGS
jgi:hypothetical protein